MTVAKRLSTVLAVALAIATAAVAGMLVLLGTGRGTLDRCSMTPRGFPTRFTSVRVEWEWLPPGNVCVWNSPQGEEMRRRPDEIFPWRDRGEGGAKLR